MYFVSTGIPGDQASRQQDCPAFTSCEWPAVVSRCRGAQEVARQLFVSRRRCGCILNPLMPAEAVRPSSNGREWCGSHSELALLASPAGLGRRSSGPFDPDEALSASSMVPGEDGLLRRRAPEKRSVVPATFATRVTWWS